MDAYLAHHEVVAVVARGAGARRQADRVAEGLAVAAGVGGGGVAPLEGLLQLRGGQRAAGVRARGCEGLPYLGLAGLF